MIGSFILGALVGGAAVWYYGREIRRFLDENTEPVRRRAAETLQAAADTLQSPRTGTGSGPGPGPAERMP